MPTSSLKLQARRQAEALGHKMRPFEKYVVKPYAYCDRCGLSVYYWFDNRTPPAGPALTERCF